MLTQREKIQQEALNKALQHNRSSLGISMGVGKTLIGLKHMEANYSVLLKVLVVAPKVSIFQSWKEDAVKFDLEYLLDHITFTTYLSLNKHQNDYDIVYLDECHSLLFSHEPFLANYDGKILGLTGTPPKRQGTEKAIMVQRYCPVIYTFGVDLATDAKILNDYRIVIHHLDLDKTKNIRKVRKDGREYYTSEESEYQYWTTRLNNALTAKERQICSIMRMRCLMEAPSKVRYAKALMNSIDDKCIVFANTQDQADSLCDYSYHSNNKDSETNLQMFKTGAVDKLSCVMQLNEGVTIPNLKAGIIMHAYGNERKSNQRLGRLLRLNPNDVAYAHILCYKDTVDRMWVNNATSDLDQEKIFNHNSQMESLDAVLTRAGYHEK